MYENRLLTSSGLPPGSIQTNSAQGHALTMRNSGISLSNPVYASSHLPAPPPLISLHQPSSTHNIQLPGVSQSGATSLQLQPTATYVKHEISSNQQQQQLLDLSKTQHVRTNNGVHMINGTQDSMYATHGSQNGVKPEIKVEDQVKPESKEDDPPEMDIFINNVVCSFSVRCHLNLKEIALTGSNVEYRRENGMVTMKLRHPYTTASIWSSGKITCTGANTENDAKIAARKFSRILQRLDPKYEKIRVKNWRIVNVLGTCNLPFGIKIVPFSQAFKEASYEPELHPGVTYKLRMPKATLKIFSTGSITVTAPSVANVQAAVEHIYPKVCEFQKPKDPEELRIDSLRGTKRKFYSTNVVSDTGISKKEKKEQQEQKKKEEAEVVQLSDSEDADAT